MKKSVRLHFLQRQISHLDRRLRELQRISERYSRWRALIVLVGGIATYLLFRFKGDLAGWLAFAALTVLSIVVAYFHKRIKNALAKHELLRVIKSAQINRANLDWVNIPLQPHITPHPSHPFETDLDVTGPRSLHQLIDTAITREGSRRLRDWLLNQRPDVELIGQRQALVRELSNLSLFRNKLLLYSALASKGSKELWDASILLNWLQQSSSKSLKAILLFLTFLSSLNLVLFTLSSLGHIPGFWPLTLLAYFGALIIISSVKAREVGSFKEALSLELALKRFKVVFQHLENYSYRTTPELAKLCAPFLVSDKRPSVQLKRVERIASALSLRANPLVWFLVHALFPWDFYYGIRLNRAKTDIKDLLPVWLDTVFELEALNSLANFAYLNPDYIFPEVTCDDERPGHIVFQSEALGHPLIPDDEKKSNDFALSEQNKIAIITGSNMGGKSTFLRTIGTNLCLAYAGAPVSARVLRVSQFRIFTCIKVSDSVTDGISYFYAEVKRLKALLSASDGKQDFPLLFLIDEIFRGTNNRERQIGSHAYIGELIRRNVTGAIATHDLELVKLSDEMTGVVNYHFREEIENGRMSFDYKLRPGPCPTTNALRIMQIEGLPVESRD